MLRFFVIEDGESHDQFQSRINTAIEEIRDAKLTMNYSPIPGCSKLTVFAQIGDSQPVPTPNGMAFKFDDLSEADVTKRLEMRRSALARGKSAGLLGPRD